ncbi:phosphoribosylformylglycinamidine cyclo-ligase [Tautonia plasticadhaerens]|uniref:Phosphoribosylformylglycinamidine cyclo-ligase n=1 Tax=Tautonia plasticadhaerens TaxID=2527974 RepID=A0A518H1S9_9BACT|nr:phosphoribosylformylglycinamidine cyclo-ligase [Tautonia plasticadhaerens]QDV34799.1 Phosphoribosylformylglycinamidine cyclo-ligase [Tautonia plasticadhaerens]
MSIPEPDPRPIDYKSAGVDLDAYERTMRQIPPLLRRTYTPRVIEWPGGFAGLFRLDDKIRLLTRTYRDPVLVASTDGVGTKLKLAFASDRHETVGIDLVAMSVNDCLCAGAEPLLFLDYVAMSRDDPDLTRRIVQGISDGCLEAECALLGGETAILPDFYKSGEYDLAGFCLGVVDRHMILDGSEVRAGDRVIGLASSGLHSNGYSLARKLALEVAGLEPGSFVPELGRTVAEEFLVPTRIYVKALKTVYRHYRVKRIIHAIAHITGGGLIDNPPRVLPEGLSICLRRGSWDVPPVFGWLRSLGNLPDEEADRVFNMGIGLVLVVSDYYADSIARYLRTEAGIPSWVIGRVEEGPRGVRWEG